MNDKPDLKELKEEHEPEAIQERIEQGDSITRYLGDGVLGGIDGLITTFAVVAGSVGGEFSGVVVVVLGFASLLADGFSMAISNYLSTRSHIQRVEQARERERRQIEHFPEGERKEIRHIFENKGLDGELLEELVEAITEDRRTWVETMLREELGLQVDTPQPLYAAGATFLAFVLIGFIPLAPFLFPDLDPNRAFLISGIATGVGFLAVGIVKGLVLKRSLLRSGLETLLTGGITAVLAYFVGRWIRQAYGGGTGIG